MLSTSRLKKFDEKSTKKKQFHTKEVKGEFLVPMMIMEDYFKVTLLKNVFFIFGQEVNLESLV